MKTLKPLICALLMCMLYVTQAQDACFGTFVFNAEGSTAPNMKFTVDYRFNLGWSLADVVWHFGDGTSQSMSNPYPVFHNYTTTDSAVNVCVIIKAFNQNQICIDTFCKVVELCNPHVNNRFFLSSVSNRDVVFSNRTFLYPGGSYPYTQTVDFGDNSAPVTYVVNNDSTYDYAHTYNGTGNVVVTLRTSSSNQCVKDTMVFLKISGAPACGASANFTYQHIGNNGVQFTNSSTNTNGYSLNWLFTDIYNPVGTSTLANPQVTFSGYAPHQAYLVIMDSLTGCKDTMWKRISMPCNLTASFTSVVNGASVQFINTSGENVETWRFYNSTTQIGMGYGYDTVNFTFYGAPPYTARLTVGNSVGCKDSIQLPVSPVVPACNINAAFTYNIVGSTVYFTNTSTAPSGFTSSWRFSANGNGLGNSNATNPSKVFGNQPPYTARLIVHDNANIGCYDTLEVTIPMITNCYAIQPNATTGVDALVRSNMPNQNYGNSTNFSALAWASNGDTSFVSSLIKFDLSAIPSNAIILSARLSLYADSMATEGMPGAPTHFLNNAYLGYAASAWNENTVTWNNKPNVNSFLTFVTEGSFSQDIINYQISSAVVNWHANPATNYGFMLTVPQLPYRNIIFCSSDHPVVSKRPKLEVCYTIDSLQCNVQALFTYQNTGGNTYQFTNTSGSSNGLSSLNFWTFSNANGSLGFANSTNNPFFTFSGPLPYSAKLLVRDSLISGCADSIELAITADTCATTASFTYQNTGGNTYQFTNTSSSNNGYASDWTFTANGIYIGNSTATNPQFTFTGSPPFVAILNIGDLNLPCNDSIHVDVDPPTGPCNTQASFSYQNTSGNTYQFLNTGTSNGAVGYSYWSYFNANGQIGSALNQHNPAFTFTGPAPYSVRLTIADYLTPSCRDSALVVLNTNQGCNINADFTYTANVSGTISFTNTSTSANPVSTSWYFYAPNYIGFDIDPNPHKNFLGFSGPYSATLIIVDSATMCRDTITKNIAVNIPACTANASFTYQFTSANTVAFTNTSSSNNGYTSIWTFSNSSGPFTGSSTTNPIITLSGAGPYLAKLEVRDSAGGVCWDTTVLQLNVQTTCITLRPGAEGIDALASQILADSSLGSYHPDLNMSQWTYGGINKETRALLKYDLSMIPAGATITSARLSLYAATNTASSYVGQPTYGSNNASYIKQITAPWGEATVTWNNQPTTTTAGQVLLAQASNAAQSYLNINIQPFVQNWVNNPAQNYGMMMDMITTNYYNALIFGSSDNPDSTLHPKLEICYITNNQCNISAAFTSNNNSNNISLVNQSSPLDSIVQYRVQAYLPNSSTPYISQVGSTFNSVKDLVLLPDTLMNICLIAYNAGGSCTDTFCNTVFTGLCNLSASFTTISTGTTVLTYNNTTFNHTTTYQWYAPGASPSQSTAATPTFSYAQNGPHNICLIATNVAGCTDTFCNTVTTGPQPSTDTLCGMVYIDANSNGLFDVGEQTRPNSTININGVLYYTDNSGFYRAPVPSGGHLISLIAPPGWVQTFPDTPLTYLITTYAGDYICGLDFGMRDDTLILSGTVYNDNNNNGIYDAGDTPRANAAVYISGTNGNYSVTTNGLGYYSQIVFSGTYNLSYNTPSGFIKTQPINPGTYTVTAYNTSITGLNFGVRDNSIAISGRVFVDANNNGIYDSGEQGIYNQQVHIGGAIVYTAANGTWGIARPAGTYNVWYAPTGNYVNYTVTTPSSYTVNAAVPGTNYGNNNFGVYIAPGTSDACVTLSQVTNVTPALGLAKYKIVVTNYGNTAMSGTLEMNYDPLLTYHSANITPSSINTANYNVKWLVSLSVGQTVYIYPNFTAPSNAVLGTHVFNHIFYQPAQGFTDINMACNEDTLHQQVLTSYDPNDKYVSPIGQGNSHAIRNVGQKLDYTIMFQNTGNSPAVNVILLDTIEADLDMTSFEMKDASHPYHLQIEGREIRWIFSNIMLPDSNTHIDSSMGFVSFSMNAATGLPDGTMVSNRAGIYFDYNDAVATGIAFNTIDKTTSISEIESGVDIALQPNPFTTYTNLIINGGDDKWPYTLQVYDMTGRVVQQATSMNNMIRIERNGMAQGIYMYEVKQNNKLIGKGKMIAE